MHAAPMGTSTPGGLGGPQTVMLVLSPVHASPCDVLGLLPAVVAPLLEGGGLQLPHTPTTPTPKVSTLPKLAQWAPIIILGALTKFCAPTKSGWLRT